MDLVEQITGGAATGKILQSITLFTGAFDQITDIKIKFVSERFLDRLEVHNLCSYFFFVFIGKNQTTQTAS